MLKKLFIYFSIVTLILMLVPAFANQHADAETVQGTTQTEETSSTSTEAEAATSEAEAEAEGEQTSVMDLPVDFSTPEKVEESIEKVREQAGDDEARELSYALGYILAYDLSVGGKREKMYKKLDGRTPNAIIAKTKR